MRKRSSKVSKNNLVGVDLGTGNLVSAIFNNDKIELKSLRDAYIIIPKD
jgi:Ethanolamine utilization protein EutJ (predicted chaperonin)